MPTQPTTKLPPTVVLQDIKFAPTLDLYEMCTPELQKKLNPMREAMKSEEDQQAEATKQVCHSEL